MSTPDDSEEWQFSLEDIEEGEASEDGQPGEHSETDAEADGNVAGTLRPERPVTPESINPENAFFMLVGALIAGLFVGAVLSLAL
jgi:hypothetical protein